MHGSAALHPGASGEVGHPLERGGELGQQRPPGSRQLDALRMAPEQAHARKRRGQWMALALIGFVMLVFVLTMTKMGANILVRDL